MGRGRPKKIIEESKTEEITDIKEKMDVDYAKTKKKKEENIVVFPTGCDLLDLVVGGGLVHGFVGGTIINIVGDKSSGKTFEACEIVAASYQKYVKRLRWCYDDAESGFTFNTKHLYGLEIIPENIDDRRKSETVEEFYCNLRAFLDSLKKDEVGIYILDSLDGLSSKEIMQRGNERYTAFKKGKDFEKGSFQMGAAKFLSQEFFKNVTNEIHDKKALLIIISQTRDKIDSLFKEQTRSGGKALDFYAHTALWLSTAAKIKKHDTQVGVTVKAHAKKSKTPRPYRTCYFTLIYDYGLDNIGSNIDYLFDLRDIRGQLKPDSKMSWDKSEDGNSRKASTGDIREFLKENKMLREYIKEKKNSGTKMMDWIISQPELYKKFSSIFGQTMKREEMITFVEKNNKQKELSERVFKKWEDGENELRSNRMRKYG